MKSKPKISLIGSGNIGGTIAHLISLKNLADVVMFDITEGLPQGKALDIMQSTSLSNSNIVVTGTNDYKHIENSEVIIVTAGLARKPGMTRDDLLKINKDIIKTTAINIKEYSPNAFVIVVTNPLDAMVYTMFKESALNRKKIVGMSGVLDSARLNHFLAQEFNVSVENISSFVLGSHGDLMVPLIRYSTISGVPVLDLVKTGMSNIDNINMILQRTKNAGAEIVSMLKNGSAYYAPASSCVEMAECYLMDKRKIITCSAHLQGEYGEHDIFAGVPVVIGKDGVEKIIELVLTESENFSLKDSMNYVRNLIEATAL